MTSNEGYLLLLIPPALFGSFEVAATAFGIRGNRLDHCCTGFVASFSVGICEPLLPLQTDVRIQDPALLLGVAAAVFVQADDAHYRYQVVGQSPQRTWRGVRAVVDERWWTGGGRAMRMMIQQRGYVLKMEGGGEFVSVASIADT